LFISKVLQELFAVLQLALDGKSPGTPQTNHGIETTLRIKHAFDNDEWPFHLIFQNSELTPVARGNTIQSTKFDTYAESSNVLYCASAVVVELKSLYCLLRMFQPKS